RTPALRRFGDCVTAPRAMAGGRWASGRPRGLQLRLQLALQDPARRADRQLVYELHGARILVSGHTLLGVRDQFFGSDRVARLELDDGLDLLAEPLVGDADHSGCGDGRVRVQLLLDLTRIDVEATADDQLLLAVHDEEIAVVIDIAHVPSVEPATAHHLGRSLRLVEVALHHVVPADHDLPDVLEP